MKRFTMFLLMAALVVPAVALARHGRDDDRGLHRSHGRVGTVTAYDAGTGELTVTTRKGRAITALVTDDTRIKCKGGSTAAVARHGDDDDDDSGSNSGPGHGGREDDDDDDEAEASPTATPEPAETAEPEETVSPEPTETAEPEDDDDECTPAEGMVVRRARIDFDDDDAVWTKLVLKR